ncbi:MAG: hypothetical protein F4X16_12445 [Caldilineaceae bacterium SB0661_bin_34]|nr:hypothetical protein [Caldilineaceae bacterium SB0661_bin_34]
MNLTFKAIDIETANADRSSICQIGIVNVVNGVVVSAWQSLINPECHFDSFNTRLHGIDEQTVQHSPTLTEIHDEIRQILCRRMRCS